jgi:hypothetical protein
VEWPEFVHVKADTMDSSLKVEVEMMESSVLPAMTFSMTMHYYSRSFHLLMNFVKHLFENSDNLLSVAVVDVEYFAMEEVAEQERSWVS